MPALSAPFCRSLLASDSIGEPATRFPNRLQAGSSIPKLAVQILTLAVFISQPARAEEWQLTYAVVRQEVTQDPQSTAEPKRTERSSTTTVTLGREYLVVSDGPERKLFDFTRRRAVNVHLDQHTFDDWSLFSHLGSRIREIQNRTAIHAQIQAMKNSPHDAFGRFENETSLGLALPGKKGDEPEPVIERKDLSGRGWDFSHAGVRVVQFVPAETLLPATFRPRFSNFLAYECSIHPDIRRQITAAGEIPQLLVINWQVGYQQNTVTYRLQSAKSVEGNSSVLPSDFQPSPPEGKPYRPLVEIIARSRDKTQRSTREEVDRFVQEAITAKRPLDAYLTLIEYRLQSGEKHANDLRRYQKEFEQDPRCRLYVASLDQSSKEACRKSLATCESIDRTGLLKAYMLDLQRADLLQILGRGNRGATTPGENNATATAGKLFLAVLNANPFLAGAYHDLGVLYDETFQSHLAWLCFDTGRQLSPDHFLFNGISTLEQRFQNDFPDFF